MRTGKRKWCVVLLIAICVLLTGCASKEEREQKKQFQALERYMGLPDIQTKNVTTYTFQKNAEGKAYESFQYRSSRLNRVIRIKDNRITEALLGFSELEILDDADGFDVTYDIGEEKFMICYDSSKSDIQVLNYYYREKRLEANYIMNHFPLNADYEKYLKEKQILDYMEADLADITEELRQAGIELDLLESITEENLNSFFGGRE